MKRTASTSKRRAAPKRSPVLAFHSYVVRSLARCRGHLHHLVQGYSYAAPESATALSNALREFDAGLRLALQTSDLREVRASAARPPRDPQKILKALHRTLTNLETQLHAVAPARTLTEGFRACEGAVCAIDDLAERLSPIAQPPTRQPDLFARTIVRPLDQVSA